MSNRNDVTGIKTNLTSRGRHNISGQELLMFTDIKHLDMKKFMSNEVLNTANKFEVSLFQSSRGRDFMKST